MEVFLIVYAVLIVGFRIATKSKDKHDYYNDH